MLRSNRMLLKSSSCVIFQKINSQFEDITIFQVKPKPTNNFSERRCLYFTKKIKGLRERQKQINENMKMLSEECKDKNRKESQKIKQLLLYSKQTKSLRENDLIKNEVSPKIDLKSQTFNIQSKHYSLNHFSKSLRQNKPFYPQKLFLSSPVSRNRTMRMFPQQQFSPWDSSEGTVNDLDLIEVVANRSNKQKSAKKKKFKKMNPK